MKLMESMGWALIGHLPGMLPMGCLQGRLLMGFTGELPLGCLLGCLLMGWLLGRLPMEFIGELPLAWFLGRMLLGSMGRLPLRSHWKGAYEIPWEGCL